LFDRTSRTIRDIPYLALIPPVIPWFGIDEQARLVDAVVFAIPSTRRLANSPAAAMRERRSRDTSRSAIAKSV
jgi:ABC-type nitrate/sulfonate/bicarbonate transport system permease component